jgi:hypothetical protein
MIDGMPRSVRSAVAAVGASEGRMPGCCAGMAGCGRDRGTARCARAVGASARLTDREDGDGQGRDDDEDDEEPGHGASRPYGRSP